MDSQKKSSLFSGIFPSDPVPAPVPLPAAKPAVAEDHVASLKQKMDLMERNIVDQLQKKLAEQPPLPPAPPSPVAPALLSKLAEMESRMKDFQDKYLMGAAQMKNIEESKIGARREIEELLKVVREQQKYSELDRQMHDQLEKAWSRVEEMEKRLLEVYSNAVKKPAEAPSSPVPAVDVRPELKELQSRLFSRLDGVEAQVRTVSGEVGVVSGEIGAISGEVESVSGVLRSMQSDISGLKTELLSVVRKTADAFSGNASRQEELAARAALEVSSSLSKLIDARVDEILLAQKRQEGKLEAFEARIVAGNDVLSGEVTAVKDALSKSMDERFAGLSAESQANEAAQLASIKELFGLVSGNITAMSVSSEVISGTENRLKKAIALLNAFGSALSHINLEGIRGVSGEVLRENVRGIAGLAGELERDRGALHQAGTVIQKNLQRLSTAGGGEYEPR